MNFKMKIIFCLLMIVVAVKGQYREHKTNLASFKRFTDYFDSISDGSRSKPRRYVDRPAIHKGNLRFPDSLEDSRDKSNESGDENYRSYTIGTHFQVGNPSTYVLRKNSERERERDSLSKPSVSNSYGNFRLTNSGSKIREYAIAPLSSSGRQSKPRNPKKPIFKPSLPESVSSEFDEYERPRNRNKYNKRYNDDDEDDDNDSGRNHSDYDDNGFIPSFGNEKIRKGHKKNYDLENSPNIYPRESQFRGVASKKQIEKYLEDQQKIIDQAIQLKLLNDPNPSARGKYHQFLKSKDDERIEKEYEEELKKKPQNIFKGQIPKRINLNDSQKSVKKLHHSPGLGHFQTTKHNPGAYSFNINL